MWRSIRCRLVYQNSPWTRKKFSQWPLASLFLRTTIISSERSKPYPYTWSWTCNSIWEKGVEAEFVLQWLTKQDVLQPAIQQIFDNTQMHTKQSHGYSLLRIYRHAASIYVDLTECHAAADFHFPFEVKDSVENLMKIMKCSPEKGTNCTYVWRLAYSSWGFEFQSLSIISG